MTLNASNAAFGIAEEYEELVLIGDIEDEGTNRLMNFLSLDSNNLWIIDLEIPGVGQVHLLTEKLRRGVDH